VWKPGNILAIALSAAALAGIVWWNWSAFALIGIDMPVFGWAALLAGVVLTIAVGGGLMFLVFFSSRRGYDDAVRMEWDEKRTGADGEGPAP